MNRLANHRAFISFLILMLQLAFLPNAKRCSLSSQPGRGCCCSAVDQDRSNSDRSGSDRIGRPSASNFSSRALASVSSAAHSHRTCCSGTPNSGDLHAGDLSDGSEPEGDHGKRKRCSCFAPVDLAAAPLATQQGHADHLKYLPALAPAKRLQQVYYSASIDRIPLLMTAMASAGPPLHLIYQVFLI